MKNIKAKDLFGGKAILTFKSEVTHTKAIIMLVITAFLWSTGGILIKLVAWNPIAIAGGRSAIAAIVLLAFMGKPTMKFNKFIIGGALAYTGTVILFVYSTKLTSAANAILLQYTAPIYIAIFGTIFLKEKATLIDWTTIFFVLGGMVLFFINDLDSGNLLGNILAVLSGISFAFIPIFLRKQKDEKPIESIFWGNVITAIIAIPFMMSGMPDNKSILGIILLGVFQLGISYILYSIAITKIKALEAILITVLEPILNPVWVLIAIGEIPSYTSIIGGLIIIFAVVGRNIYTMLIQQKIQ